MKNQFVSYEIALKLKELGFDEKCLYSIEFSEGGKTLHLNPNLKNNSQCEIGEITLPLWQQVLDWFRDKYDIHVVITVNPYSSSSDEIYGYKIYLGPELRCKVNHEEEKQLYYVATSMAALEVLEIISNEYLLKNQL